MGSVHVAVITALDVLALLFVAVGFAWGLWPMIGGLSLIPAGLVVAAGSAYGDREAGS